MARSRSEEFDSEPTQGEARQEWPGGYDLLRHPSPRIPDFIIDYEASDSCRTRGCSIGLGPAEKCSMSRILATPDVHTKCEPRTLERWPVSASACDEITDTLDLQNEGGTGSRHHRESARHPFRFNRKPC